MAQRRERRAERVAEERPRVAGRARRERLERAQALLAQLVLGLALAGAGEALEHERRGARQQRAEAVAGGARDGAERLRVRARLGRGAAALEALEQRRGGVVEQRVREARRQVGCAVPSCCGCVVLIALVMVGGEWMGSADNCMKRAAALQGSTNNAVEESR